jgi:hypothetical protein
MGLIFCFLFVFFGRGAVFLTVPARYIHFFLISLHVLCFFIYFFLDNLYFCFAIIVLKIKILVPGEMLS